MADGGNDNEVGEEFQPGREGRERDEMEEEKEREREREREMEREMERERNNEQGARKKTKKVDGKTYSTLEETIELKEMVIDVKIGKDKYIPANVGLAAQERVKKFLNGIFEKVQYKKILLAVNELEDKYIISSTDKGSNYYALDVDGNFEDGKEHKKLRDALGKRLSKRASDFDARAMQTTQRQTTATLGKRETGQTTTTPGEREAGQRGGQREDQGIEQGDEEQREIAAQLEIIAAEREGIIERMSLREKVKYYFKKYGFTVVGILTAIGAVIGSILSNLKSGLAKVSKGVGKGLKDLGAKLAGILPGMIGAIAKFLFDTAGEVVGFLAEHAWVLIFGLVVLVVESLKKRYGRKK